MGKRKETLAIILGFGFEFPSTPRNRRAYKQLLSVVKSLDQVVQIDDTHLNDITRQLEELKSIIARAKASIRQS